jgi:DNA-binding NarL/FixJ family response regulator
MASRTDSAVYILGPRRFQNEIIALFLERETGARCLIKEELSLVGSLAGVTDHGRHPKLSLWDCQGKDSNSLLAHLSACGGEKLRRNPVVLYNLAHGLGIEEECVWRGVRGFFYEHDSLPQFLKGVHAVLNGQLWFSREIMTRFILRNRAHRNPLRTERPMLTPRERQILAEIAVGSANAEIADRLCLSPHTVKTHLYNIYKKINASNRLQAALWATKNL